MAYLHFLVVAVLFISILNVLFDLQTSFLDYKDKKAFQIENKRKFVLYLILILIAILLDIFLFKKNVSFFAGLFAIGLFLLITIFNYLSDCRLSYQLRSLNKISHLNSFSKNGFKLDKGGVSSFFYWSNITSAVFNNSHSKIELRFLDKKSLRIKSNFLGYLVFLKNIPSGINALDYNYIQQEVGSITVCTCCGYISFTKEIVSCVLILIGIVKQ